MDITGKLYTNLPVIDLPKDDPGLMYEKIDPCWGIFNRFLLLLSGVLPYFQGECGDFLANKLGAAKMEEENEKMLFRAASHARRWRALHRHKKKLVALKINTPIFNKRT